MVAVDLKNDVFAYFDSMEFPDNNSAIQIGRPHVKKIL